MSYKFSIITCTKNSAKFVNETIDSVKSQTFKDYEHIFIDGFSTDGTKELIEKYQKENPDRVKLFQFEPKGITNAMNKGIEHASGQFLIHLHSDDSFANNDVLSHVNDYLDKNPDLDWIYGKVDFINNKGRVIQIRNRTIFSSFSYDNYFLRQILKYLDVICHQTVFIRRTVFRKYGLFDERYVGPADYDLWLRIMKKTKWHFFDKIISNYRYHDESYSSSISNQEEQAVSVIIVQKRNLNKFEFFILLPLSTILFNLYFTIKNLRKLFILTKRV